MKIVTIGAITVAKYGTPAKTNAITIVLVSNATRHKYSLGMHIMFVSYYVYVCNSVLLVDMVYFGGNGFAGQ